MLPDGEQGHISSNFNILMADVSVSMSFCWKEVVQGWKRFVAPTLRGRTSIYVFSNQVFFQRSGTLLEDGDFFSGATDLVGALRTVVSEVYQCKEKYVKVYLITDGNHSLSHLDPKEVIEKMQFPVGKVCDVFVLGVGSEYPVEHSVGLRSRLHNGNSNLPYLFTAKSVGDIAEQMSAIGRNSQSYGQGIQLSTEGSSLPGGEVKDTFHPGEWVYFPCEPLRVQQLAVSFGTSKGILSLQPRPMDITNLNEMFRQWNSQIIQLYRNGEVVPPDVLPFKERLFKAQLRKLKESETYTVRDRLARKQLTQYEASFRAEVNKMETMLSKTFQSEQELADNVLFTTVGGKYEIKAFKLRGHTDKNFEEDQEEFMKVYNAQKEEVLKLESTPDDCCRITMASTVSDLQDSDFSELFQLGKYEFLKLFTITGIPVFAPTRDSTTINPWSYTIEAMLNSPYTVMSQVALESFAEIRPAGKLHKEVKIMLDEADTRFNAIVPIFPANAAKTMAPFVHTRLFAMCVTFAVLKNPHVIDFNVHMAALGVTWVYILCKYPSHPRPAFMCTRLVNIEATAALYISRADYCRYWRALKEDTAEALMTESKMKVDNKILRSETLVKPMFILYLNQRMGNVEGVGVAEIVRMVLVEYEGRCLAGYNNKRATPYTDFFAPAIGDTDHKTQWMHQYSSKAKKKLLEAAGNIVEKFYTLEKVKKAARDMVREYLKKEKITSEIIRVNLEKVQRLNNVSSAGDLTWAVLKTFAQEVGLSQEAINQLFSEQSVFVYTAHALRYRRSRERLATPLNDYDGSLAFVTKQIQSENFRMVSKVVHREVWQAMEAAWLEGYSAAHRGVVRPMSRQDIVARARDKGVPVDEATFDQVYKSYREDVGLLGNACQSEACPFFLLPHKTYNQHASVERRHCYSFPHCFHRVAYENRRRDLAKAVADLQSGRHSKTRKPVHPSAFSSIIHGLEGLQDWYNL